jgi:catechol 2,3-dioxygenase-like lactoylglutathione lyase family enzyme
VRLDHALLEVHDLGAAEEFYVGVLGFSVRKRDELRDGCPLVAFEQGLGLTTGREGELTPVEHPYLLAAIGDSLRNW